MYIGALVLRAVLVSGIGDDGEQKKENTNQAKPNISQVNNMLIRSRELTNVIRISYFVMSPPNK
jgi:hypothetical protein